MIRRDTQILLFTSLSNEKLFNAASGEHDLRLLFGVVAGRSKFVGSWVSSVLTRASVGKQFAKEAGRQRKDGKSLNLGMHEF